MAAPIQKVRLSHACVDPGDAESEVQLLLEGKFVKYLTIEAGLYDVDDMCFEPALVAMIPPLPPGDWNTARISLDPSTGQPHFVDVTNAQLPSITDIWHPLQIDHLDLHKDPRAGNFRSDVFEATCPQLDTKFVAKIARFSWEIPRREAETSMYKLLRDTGIGPKFLGHLSEEGRVMGFIIEHIPGRFPTIDDLALYQKALQSLHSLGIKHGDPNKHNFLIHDGKATLIDFETCKKENDAKVLEEEFRSLEGMLMETTGRGRRIVVDPTAVQVHDSIS